MTNTFYNKYDTATLDLRSQRETDKRTPFQVDRDRIIYSPAFRSLQSKTQVFHSGEYDFYRTRLTHSLEVAQIGRSMCNHLMLSCEPLRPDFFIDPDLVEACCLAHDIGHPPFGHAGEDALNEVLAEAGGFEGNAQTLRILTHLIFGTEGMKPTRALLDAVLKYKDVFISPKATPSKFLYTDQKEILDFVFSHPNWERDCGADLHNYRSIECQIMDWADDVAYGLMDIVDGVNAHFITLDSLEKWRRGNKALTPHEENILNELTDDLANGKLERSFAMRIGDCITGTSLAKRRNFLSRRSNRYALDLTVHAPLRARIDFYKQLATDLIFRTPQVKQLEYKGRHILSELFLALRKNYSLKKPLRLVPQATEEIFAKTPAQLDRLLADYLSGLTDTAVIRIYRRLFDPGYGSITDL